MRSIIIVPALIFVTYALAQDTTSAAPVSASSTVPVDSLETSEPGVISPNYVLRGFKGCTKQQRSAIKNGFTDMVKMLMQDQKGEYPDVDWNSGAAQDFWGAYPFNRDVRDHIQSIANALRHGLTRILKTPLAENLNRAAAVSYQWWLNPFAKRLNARCDDPLKQCDGCGPGSTDAYTIDHEPEINFCERYFAESDLSDILQAPQMGQWEYVDAFKSKGERQCVISEVRSAVWLTAASSRSMGT